MIPIGRLSVGDKVMLEWEKGNFATIISTDNVSFTYVVGRVQAKTGIGALSGMHRIPVTAENFPKDGIVWCDSRRGCMPISNQITELGGYYLPLLKDLDEYHKKESEMIIVHDCTTCRFANSPCRKCVDYADWELAEPTGTLTVSGQPAGNPFRIYDKIRFADTPTNHVLCTARIGETHKIDDIAHDHLLLDDGKWYHYSRFEPAEPEVSIALIGYIHDADTDGFWIDRIRIEWDEIPEETAAKVREALNGKG